MITLKRNLAVLFVLASGLQVLAQDQTPPKQQSMVQDNGAQPAIEDDQRAPAPALLGGDGNSLQFSSELERSNYLRGGVQLGATYDDNAASTPSGHISDFSYSVLPNIFLEQTRSRTRWSLGYIGGFVANQRLSEHNQGSHNVTGQLQYRLSPHVTMRLSDAFLATTGFLQQLQNTFNPVTGPITSPNQNVITPLAKTINNTATAELTYQFTADDMIGGGGTFYDSHFRDVPAGSGFLIDTSTRSADVFYTHRFTPRNWTSFTYKFQNMSFSTDDRTRVHSFLLSHTIYPQAHMNISFFIGPEYSEIGTQTVTLVVTPPVISLVSFASLEHSWSISGGGSFGWQGERTSVRLDGTRRVSDGGGFLGAVKLDSVNGGLRRQLAQWTVVDFNGFYGHSSSLGPQGDTIPALKSASGGVGVEQRLASNLMLRFDYGRDYQEGGTNAILGAVNHNRGSVSLSYNFTRPIGR
jgi:hypothetical protein